jgi:hypothetical protein
VQRFVQHRKAAKSGTALTRAFVSLTFSPGEACQFDWSQEHVELAGVMQTVKVAHFRLTFSRQMFVVADIREIQERVFDVHNRAFAFFGGAAALQAIDRSWDDLRPIDSAWFYSRDAYRFIERKVVQIEHYCGCAPLILLNGARIYRILPLYAGV